MKRFNVLGDFGQDEVEAENGEWVRYEDHAADRAALVAELEALKEQLPCEGRGDSCIGCSDCNGRGERHWRYERTALVAQLEAARGLIQRAHDTLARLGLQWVDAPVPLIGDLRAFLATAPSAPTHAALVAELEAARAALVEAQTVGVFCSGDEDERPRLRAQVAELTRERDEAAEADATVAKDRLAALEERTEATHGRRERASTEEGKELQALAGVRAVLRELNPRVCTEAEQRVLDAVKAAVDRWRARKVFEGHGVIEAELARREGK